jgi:DNA-binding FrmR family transcriptional regulator
MAHTKDNKSKLLARVRRLAGQVGAIERALESDSGCAAVLQQAAAVRGAVNGFIDELVEDHLREHVAHPDLSPADRAAGADELIAVIRRYSK